MSPLSCGPFFVVVECRQIDVIGALSFLIDRGAVGHLAGGESFGMCFGVLGFHRSGVPTEPVRQPSHIALADVTSVATLGAVMDSQAAATRHGLAADGPGNPAENRKEAGVQQILVEADGGEWVATFEGSTEVARGDTPDGVTDAAYDYARVNATDLKPISVQLREHDGAFGPERTYPRQADPTTSPG